MPLFIFECVDCKNKFESLIGSWKSENPQCPKCKSETKRDLSVPVMVCSDGPRLVSKKSPTPIENTNQGTIQRFAHIADRNTGKSLGFKPAGVINENAFH